MTHDGRRPWLLAIDTATSRVVVAAASPDGDAPRRDDLGRRPDRHGAQLLPAIGRLHGEANLAPVADPWRDRRDGARRVHRAAGRSRDREGARPRARRSRSPASRPPRRSCGRPPRRRRRRRPPPAPAGRPERPARGPAPATAPRSCRGGKEPDLAAGDVLVAVDLDGRAPEDALAAARRRGTASRPRSWRSVPPASRPATPTTSPGSCPDTSACRAASARRAGRSHGRATPGEGRHRGDAARGPRRGPADRAGELHHAVAAERLPQRADDEPPRVVPRRADRRSRSSRTAGCG